MGTAYCRSCNVSRVLPFDEIPEGCPSCGDRLTAVFRTSPVDLETVLGIVDEHLPCQDPEMHRAWSTLAESAINSSYLLSF